MKNFAICALLAAGVSAVPMAAPYHGHVHGHQHKRDIVWVTETDIDTVTDIITKTVYGNGANTANTANAQATGYHHGTTTVLSTATVHPQPYPTSSQAPSYSAPAAPETTTSSSDVYVPPTTTSSSSSSVYVAPSPATTSSSAPAYSAPAYTTPTSSSYAAPATTSAAPSAYSSAPASGGSGGTYVADLTYYEVGLGSCGNYDTDTENVVALDETLMDKATDCGRDVSITWGGKTITAKIVDTCPGCKPNGLDLSPSLFQSFAPTATGVLASATWSYN